MGGCAALAAQVDALSQLFASGAMAAENEKYAPYVLAQPQNMIYTTCLQCHTGCQIKMKFWDGALAKISGNPYCPQDYLPHIPYDTKPQDTATIDGKLCPKGQAGIQTYYDPYRVRKVLKRDGRTRLEPVEEHPLRPVHQGSHRRGQAVLVRWRHARLSRV